MASPSCSPSTINYQPSSESHGHALFVGRFQPPHRAHVASALAALEAAPRLTLALGSANLARSIKNPWTPAEREELWRLALVEAGADLGRVDFQPVPDFFDPELWAAYLRGLFPAGEVITLVGYEKDASSSYLGWFPGWRRLVLPELEGGISATTLRHAYFTCGADVPVLAQHLSPAVLGWLEAWVDTDEYSRLSLEYMAVELLGSEYATPPQRREQLWLWLEGRTLTLHRRSSPIGEGLWELPTRKLPAQAEGTGTLYTGGGRVRSGEVLSWVAKGEPPAEVQTKLRGGLERVPVAEALAHPRQFYGDHGVILQKLAAGWVDGA